MIFEPSIRPVKKKLQSVSKEIISGGWFHVPNAKKNLKKISTLFAMSSIKATVKLLIIHTSLCISWTEWLSIDLNYTVVDFSFFFPISLCCLFHLQLKMTFIFRNELSFLIENVLFWSVFCICSAQN